LVFFTAPSIFDVLENNMGVNREPERACTFISYARDDLEFVRRLKSAFDAEGRDTWIDLEGIPLSAEWMQEINAAIEASDACVFALTPSWINSKVCRAELQHALDNNKRIIPILHRDVDKKSVPPELAKRNWLVAREQDEFAAAFAALLETIDTDLNHVRKHTRINVRAIEWQANKYAKSFLLRSRQLNDAVDWLSTCATKEPLPTDLQQSYIESSVRNVRNRKRILTVTILFSILLFIALAYFGQQQYQQRRLQATINLSKELAARSSNMLKNGNDEDALLFASISHHLHQGRVSRAALVRAAMNDLALKRIIRFAVSIDYKLGDMIVGGQVIVSAGGPKERLTKKRIRVWDAGTGTLLRTLDGHPTVPYRMVLSDDDSILASVSHSDQKLHLWDTVSGELLHVVTQYQRPLRNITLAPDGATIAYIDSADTFRILGTRSGELLGKFQGSKNTAVPQISWSGGRFLGIIFQDTTAQIRDILSGELLLTLTLHPDNHIPRFAIREELSNVAVSRDGRRVASSWQDSVRLQTISDEAPIRQLKGAEATIEYMAFSPDGSLLAARAENKITIWDVADGSLRQRLPGKHFVWSPDSTYLASAFGGEMILWNAKIDGPLIKPTSYNASIKRLRFLRDETHIVSIAGHGGSAGGATARLWDITPVEHMEATLIGHTGPVRDAVYSTDGNRIASASADKTVRIWDAVNNKLLHTLTGHQHPVYRVQFSPDDAYLATFAGDIKNISIRIWDAETGALANIWQHAGNFIDESTLQLVFSPDSQHLAFRFKSLPPHVWPFVDGGAGIQIWRHRNDGWDVSGNQHFSTYVAQRKYTTFAGQDDWIYGLQTDHRFPDYVYPVRGKHGRANLIGLYEPGNDSPVKLVSGHEDNIRAIKLSPKRLHIASASGDKTIRLWETMSGEHVMTLTGHTDAVTEIDFSPAGDRIVSASFDHTVRVWRIDSTPWQERVCGLLGRNPNCWEWCKEVGGPYQIVCPEYPDENECSCR